MADKGIVVDSAKEDQRNQGRRKKKMSLQFQKRNQSTDEARLFGTQNGKKNEYTQNLLDKYRKEQQVGTKLLLPMKQKTSKQQEESEESFNHEVIHFNVKSDVTGKVESHANGFNGAIHRKKIRYI